MRVFGEIAGRKVHEVTIAASDGSISAEVIEYGAVIRDAHVKTPAGGKQRVVLGLDKLEDYAAHSPHFGAIAGRYGNRIRDGKFWLDGKAYQLPLNQDGKHSLHGGGQGLGKRPWTIHHTTPSSVTLIAHSPDGEHGHPGALTVQCRYEARAGGALSVTLSATTTAATPINLLHHSYFNLDGSADVLDHTLEVRANTYTPVNADLIPDGSILPVAGTPFDFRTARPIKLMGKDGKRAPYDYNAVLRRDRTGGRPAGHANDLALAATLASPKSGLAMDVWTTEPGLQIYDGFKLSLPVPGHGGVTYAPSAGICLEPQHFPDSPNLPHFPSAILRPGNVYLQTTAYAFRAASAAATPPAV